MNGAENNNFKETSPCKYNCRCDLQEMVCVLRAETSGTFVADIVGHLCPSNSYMKVRDITRTCGSQVLVLSCCLYEAM